MNLEQNPTPDELRELIATCDDRAGHHVLWVAKNGDVHVTRVPKDRAPGDFEDDWPDLQLRYEPFQAGNEYVGPEAAADSDWINELFDALTREWPNARGKQRAELIGQF